MTSEEEPERPALWTVKSNPYATWVFLVLYLGLAGAVGLMSQSFILFGVLLLFTVPFVLLATAFWMVIKEFFRMIFFEL